MIKEEEKEDGEKAFESSVHKLVLKHEELDRKIAEFPETLSEIKKRCEQKDLLRFEEMESDCQRIISLALKGGDVGSLSKSLNKKWESRF